jgi:hypothetical protein
MIVMEFKNNTIKRFKDGPKWDELLRVFASSGNCEDVKCSSCPFVENFGKCRRKFGWDAVSKLYRAQDGEMVEIELKDGTKKHQEYSEKWDAYLDSTLDMYATCSSRITPCEKWCPIYRGKGHCGASSFGVIAGEYSRSGLRNVKSIKRVVLKITKDENKSEETMVQKLEVGDVVRDILTDVEFEVRGISGNGFAQIKSGIGTMSSCYLDGRDLCDHKNPRFVIVRKAKKKVEVDFWVNVYPGPFGSGTVVCGPHHTQQDAKANVSTNLLATLNFKQTIEV